MPQANHTPKDVERIVKRLESLRPIFARAAIGDYSADVPPYETEDELTEFAVGLQIMLEVIREKIAKHEELQKTLEEKIVEYADTQRALLNVMEDEKQTRAQLELVRQREAEEKKKLEILVESVGEGIIAVDEKLQVVMVNSAAYAILKATEKDIIGKQICEVMQVMDSDKKVIPENEYPCTLSIQLKKRLVLGNLESPYYLKSLYHDPVPVSLTSTPLLSNGTRGAVIVIRDISEEVAHSRTRSEFITVASHQLKSPMTIIRWISEWLTENETLSEEGKKLLNDLHSASLRLTSLTDTLLNVSRLEEGMVRVDVTSVDVGKLVSEYCNLLSSYAKEKEVTLQCVSPSTPVKIKSDAALITVIVQVLLTNALDYTLAGGTVSIAAARDESRTVIKVWDSGIGIPQQEQHHIFTKFYRAPNAVPYKVEGTGLGLYTAKKITDLLGGKLWFESQEGKGSMFFVELPEKIKAREGTKQLVF
ncbi:PAS domain-containing protein [Candidatus Uhrbacteria bacterium]|nr:PAS domain-containing protein [Candidatus Uhrbacteria bacterium]